jgi:hypothetical protein
MFSRESSSRITPKVMITKYACILLALTAALHATVPNTLTIEEQRAGWKLLWDGKTAEGWRSARADKFPAKGWQMKDGVLLVLKSDGSEGGRGGDIVTREKYSDFELSVDFKITPGANSGIKYFVDAELNKGPGSSIGLEYQILDDVRHPDAKEGRNGNRTLASVYDLYPASAAKRSNPVGEWNTARVVSRGAHVEHWLNGEKVVEYDRFTPTFRKDVQESKYKTWPGFGEWKDGHILLQDHGDEVHFRNLKIRVLTNRIP